MEDPRKVAFERELTELEIHHRREGFGRGLGISYQFELADGRRRQARERAGYSVEEIRRMENREMYSGLLGGLIFISAITIATPFMTLASGVYSIGKKAYASVSGKK